MLDSLLNLKIAKDFLSFFLNFKISFILSDAFLDDENEIKEMENWLKTQGVSLLI
jgi:hypothetical protein